MDNENLKTLYNALITPSASTQNRALFDKSQIGSNPKEFAKILSNTDNAKMLYDALLTPKAEFGNRSLFDKSQIGSSVEDFNNIFGLQKKNPIGFESSNGSVPSPLASSMYAPVQGMGEKVEKQVKNAPLVSSQYAPVEGMGMAPTGGVAEFGKYLYNKLLTGAGGVAAGTTDFITQATPSYVPKEATAITIRNSVSPYLRNFLKESVGAKQSKEQEKVYDDGFVTGSIGGLAESVPAMLTGVPGLFAQAYDSSLQSINNSKFAKDLSETEKSAFALSVGGVSSILEKYGLDKIFTKSKAFNAFSDKLTGLIIDRLASKGLKITPKLISQEASAVVDNITKKAIKSGIRITDAALTEGITGGSQEIATIGLEEVINKYKGRDVFDNGSMGAMMGRVIKAAGQEAIGGGIMGGFASVMSGDLTDKRTLASVASAPNSSEAIPVMVDEINRQVESNQITKDEADQAFQYLNLSAANNSKIPDNISEEKRSEALEILNEKTALEDVLAQREAAAVNLDPAFKDTKATEIADIKAQIEEKNQLLKTIGNGEAPISAEQPKDFIYYERDGEYFKKEGVGSKEQPITKTTYDFERRKQDLEEGLRNADKKGQDIAVVGDSLIPIEDAQKELDTLNQNKQIESENISVETLFSEAGENSKTQKDPKPLANFLLVNSKVGDTILDSDGNGYEITEVKISKKGEKEIVLVPFEMKDGVKDYNYPGTKLISDSSKKAASDLYEYSYTNNNGDRISEKYTYKPTEGVKPEVVSEQQATDIEAQKADIEKRRQEELKGIVQPTPIEVYDENGNLVQTTDKAVDINKKYDAELAALETTKPTEELLPSTPEFEKQMEEKYGIVLDLLDYKGGVLQLSKIIVSKKDRNSGIGKKAMQEIVDYADKVGKKITLTPSTDFGATSVNRLKAFYKGFGFVENIGKNKDYSTKETMYRQPIDNKEINKTTKPTEDATKICWWG